MANRSGREGMFLKASERESLLRRLARSEKRSRQTLDDQVENEPPLKDGCRVCRKDDDHGNMLLCEKCSAEYHFYCIGLATVPMEDWFCDICKADHEEEECDGLELRVAALPPTFTSRFGEIVWAQGGPGYGWWPSYIYDPRMTVGGARDLAKKHLAKKHLVYFFQCLEAPFAALPDSKLTEWYVGLTENYHLGKAARHTGKNRAAQFSEALKIANLELGKPIEHRMDWNHPEPSRAGSHVQPLLPPHQRQGSGQSRKRGRPSASNKSNVQTAAAATPDQSEDDSGASKECLPTPCRRTNLEAAVSAHNSAVVDEDEELYLRVLLGQSLTNIGFVKFGSRALSTFRDARNAVIRDLDCLQGTQWKFYIQELGPISATQEISLGPMLHFLQSASTDLKLGDGTIRRPVKVVIINDVEIPLLVE